MSSSVGTETKTVECQNKHSNERCTSAVGTSETERIDRQVELIRWLTRESKTSPGKRTGGWAGDMPWNLQPFEKGSVSEHDSSTSRPYDWGNVTFSSHSTSLLSEWNSSSRPNARLCCCMPARYALLHACTVTCATGWWTFTSLPSRSAMNPGKAKSTGFGRFDS